MTGCPDHERVARAALAAAVEPPGERVARHLIDHGIEATLAALREGGHDKLDPEGRVHRRLAGVDGAALLASATALGIRFVCPADAEWPAVLDQMSFAAGPGDKWVAPPIGLWVRGDADLAALAPRSVAVVGARAATDYGRRIATELGADLASRGWAVVSGAAYGIDGAAHRGALAVGGTTVAVLACGADLTYPRGHTELLRRILDGGLIVSELPPGTVPSRPRFLARNRLIAALTRGTVVVEAARRSGALSTASWATYLHRPLGAVPGPVTSAMSAGCHKIIRAGAAVLVTDAAEVADHVGDFGTDAAADERVPDGPLDRLEPTTRDVYEAIPARQAVTVDQLCAETGLSVPACMAALGRLGASGLVARADGGWRLAKIGHGAPKAAMLDLD
jgi:DNA processing protein